MKARFINNTHHSFNRRTALFATTIIIIILVLAAWLLHNMGQRAQKSADTLVRLEVRQYYTVSFNDKPAFYFTGFNTDSTMRGISATKDSIRVIPQYQQGRFYNAISVLPSCLGRIRTSMPAVKTNPNNIKWKGNARLLANKQQTAMDSILRVANHELDELGYYMRVHSVIDEGYHIVANYKNRLDSTTHRLTAIQALLEKNKNSRISISLVNEYTAIYITDSGKTKREACELERMDGKDVYLRLLSHKTPSTARLFLWPWEKPRNAKPWHVKNGYCEATDSLGRYIYGIFDSDTLRSAIRFDSAGVYVGEVNRYGIANGHGLYRGYDGSYYEGNWTNDERENWGFALNPHKPMRAGEWQHDVYKGEVLTYTSNRIYGIDISKYQHEKGKNRYSIDWSNLRITHLGSRSQKRIKGSVDYPVRFVFIKSTEGATLRNAYSHADYVGARSHGLHVGAYHFFSLRSRGSDQARFFLRNSSFKKGDLPPVLDVEPTKKQIEACGGVNVMWTNIKAWLRTVEQQTGTRPILYVSQIFVNRYLPLAPDVKKNYPVWIARYGQYKPDIRLAIWQLCEDGKVRGIHGLVDINVFNGYNDEFSQFLKTGIQ